MHEKNPELLEKIRQQFEFAPYPNKPLDQSPKDDYELLYVHNLITSYYLRNQKVLDTEGKVILDAGCGSGYKSLILAEANPGAKIVGIDLSEESVKLARQRLQYYEFNNAEFHVLSIEELPKLNINFDYINCDEVLYLLPDINLALATMKSVLKPGGLIRGNLHNAYQRVSYFRAQELFTMMGLMEQTPRELEIELVRDIMISLKEQVILKAKTWTSLEEESDQSILMNYLFQGDKGYTIPQLFTALQSADLEFVSMVNWRHWELMDLFKEPENLPHFLSLSLPDLSIEDYLHLFELLHPVHRLMDFWCAHPHEAESFVPVSQWTLSDWQQARVFLHPQLKSNEVREDLIACINNHNPFLISRYIPLPTLTPIAIDSNIAACLLPLWDSPQPLLSLVQRWLKLRPFHPVTLEAVTQQEALKEISELLQRLEVFLYILLERAA